MKTHIDQHEGGLDTFSQSYLHYGVVVTSDGMMCREWIPNVTNVFLYGDFSKLFCYYEAQRLDADQLYYKHIYYSLLRSNIK